jgi:hypothetical protein
MSREATSRQAVLRGKKEEIEQIKHRERLSTNQEPKVHPK